MGRMEKVLTVVLSGRSDHNITFADLRHLLLRLGFDERIRGSHHIFTRTAIEEILNLQPNGAMSKGYQVKQVRGVILKYQLSGDHDTQV